MTIIIINFAGKQTKHRIMHHLRHTLFLLLLLLGNSQTEAQTRANTAYQLYISQYKDLAIEQMERYRIPASITLAQGLFESGAGRSRLATLGNNHFGIKCHGWSGRTISADDDAKNECFRAYDNPKQSYEDHSKFLRNNTRYARLFKLSVGDYRGWAHGLKACGYATNPNYANNLINIIELYRLYQYDSAKTYDHFMADRYNANNTSGDFALTHPVHKCNKNYYIVAREGDTFKSLGKETGVSWRKLAKYNERNKRDKLSEGDIIFLEKKQKKAMKEFRKHPHTVRAGESMYSIAQLYGIRLKSLYKMNNMSADDGIKVGMKLKIR